MVAGRETRVSADRHRGDHAVDERAASAPAEIEEVGSKGRIAPVERNRLTQKLRGLFHDRGRHGPTQEFRPCKRREPNRFSTLEPAPKCAILGRSRDERANEKARIEVKHAVALASRLARGTPFGAGPAGPRCRHRLREVGSAL